MGLVLFLKESIVGLGQYVESLKVMPINIESHKESNSCLFTFGQELFSCLWSLRSQVASLYFYF